MAPIQKKSNTKIIIFVISVEAKPEQIEKKNVALVGLALLYLSVMFCLF